jgi:hypothetical protein
MTTRTCWIVAAATLLLAGSAPSARAQSSAGAAQLPPDPADTKLVLAPTARTLPRGDVSIMFLGIFPIAQVGLTDRLSIGGGVFGVSGPIIAVTPKYQVIRRPGTSFTVGALHFQSLDAASLGLAYGVVTHGTDDNAVTVGMAWLYIRDEADVGAAPAAIVGAEHRISSRGKLVADAYLFDGGAWTSAAYRLVWTHVAVDLGLMFSAVNGHALAFPVVLVLWRR